MPSETSALSMKWMGYLIPLGLFLLLVALLVPAILRSRDVALRTVSRNNLKQFGLGLINYEDTFKTLPPGGTFDGNGIGHHGWMTFVEPYLAASPWYLFVDYHVPWDDPLNVDVFLKDSFGGMFMQNPRVSETRSYDGFRLAHYAANQNLMYRNSVTRVSEISSSPSSTFVLGEANGIFLPTGSPYNWRDPSLGIGLSNAGFGCPNQNET